MSSLPTSDRRLECVRVATAEDPELSEVLRKTQYGWPDYEKSIKIEIRPYFTTRFLNYPFRIPVVSCCKEIR